VDPLRASGGRPGWGPSVTLATALVGVLVGLGLRGDVSPWGLCAVAALVVSGATWMQTRHAGRGDAGHTESLALTLLHVAQELNQAADPPALLSHLATRARELTGAESVVIALRRGTAPAYRLEMVQGLPAAQAERLQGVELDEATVLRHLPTAAGLDPSAGRHLSAPLERGGERTGVMLLVWRAGFVPSPHQQALALGLAGQAANALQTVRMLDASRKMKSAFVATMSHELRTPLNVIMGYTDLLIEEAFGAIPPEQSEVLGRMQHSARELLDLITATLDIGRFEAGQSRLSIQQVDVAQLLAQIQTEEEARLDHGHLALIWEVGSDLPAVETDPAKLRIVLKNLIGNAIKFTEKGRVTVSVEADGDGVAFTVADTGCGIRKADTEAIFDMFRQLESVNTRRHGGVGLGLYTVKQFVGELGGRIDVDSEPGAGSRFRVRIPARLANAPATAAA
jgi:signal transduction histidine kinase